MKRERMSPSFAVFNGHVNNADKRARAMLKEFLPDYLARIEELEAEGGGIMHIFNVDQEHATTAYVVLVTAYVNEEAEARVKQLEHGYDELRTITNRQQTQLAAATAALREQEK